MPGYTTEEQLTLALQRVAQLQREKAEALAAKEKAEGELAMATTDRDGLAAECAKLHRIGATLEADATRWGGLAGRFEARAISAEADAAQLRAVLTEVLHYRLTLAWPSYNHADDTYNKPSEEDWETNIAGLLPVDSARRATALAASPCDAKVECDGCKRMREQLDARRRYDVRPKVVLFSRVMERKLAAHDGDRTGWNRCGTAWLMDRLLDEAKELSAAVVALEKQRKETPTAVLSTHRSDVADEAADVANFAMMIADVSGGLDSDVTDSGSTALAATKGGEGGEVSAPTRDPRVDPRPGDVVRVMDGIGLPIDRIVCRVITSTISWVVGRLGYDATPEEWRRINADAEVVTVAEVKP